MTLYGARFSAFALIRLWLFDLYILMYILSLFQYSICIINQLEHFSPQLKLPLHIQAQPCCALVGHSSIPLSLCLSILLIRGFISALSHNSRASVTISSDERLRLLTLLVTLLTCAAGLSSFLLYISPFATTCQSRRILLPTLRWLVGGCNST